MRKHLTVIFTTVCFVIGLYAGDAARTNMIIDHTMVSNPTLELYDGSHYFEACKGYNWEHSKRLREYGSMVTWFVTNYPEHMAVK